ncbi:MAG TPA: recombinase RecT [Hanamia sp.]|jgi:hypothetical protein|nr:recombinase RecT [Hanamia sp.]
MTNEIQTQNQTKIVSPALTSQMFMPTTYADAMQFCEKASKADFIPSGLKGKPMDIFLAWQMGATIGLDFFASIQNIAVINGRPCIWGDAALAVVVSHPHYISHDEWFEIKGQRVTSFLTSDPDLVAFCSITRKGQEPKIKSFSVKDAIQAKLWEKQGVWQQYPKRMLQMRARSWAIRDAFPDALKGIAVREEIIDLPSEDYHVIETKDVPKLGIEAVSQVIAPPVESKKTVETVVNPDTGELIEVEVEIKNAPSFGDVYKQLESATNIQELIFAKDLARSAGFTPEQISQLATLFKKRQTEMKA